MNSQKHHESTLRSASCVLWSVVCYPGSLARILNRSGWPRRQFAEMDFPPFRLNVTAEAEKEYHVEN